MRGGLDIILGGLLLSSGVLVPGLWSDDVFAPPHVTGEATFDIAHYTGPGEVQASEAALEVQGPVKTTLHVEEVHITRLDRQGVRISHGNEIVERHQRTIVALQESSTARYENATIHVEGFDDGQLQAWPNADVGQATFNLELSPRTSTPIAASAPSVSFLNHGEHYVLDGPLFALGDSIDRRVNTEPIEAGFDHLDLAGGLNLLVDNGTVSIIGDDGTTRYDAKDRWSRSDPSSQIHARDHSILLLSLRGTTGTVDLQDLKSTFFAREPDWMVNGTLQFDASAGRLSAAGTNRSLHDASVTIQGRTSLSLTAVGTDRTSFQPPIVEYRTEIVHDHRAQTQARIDSDAENVSVAGEPVQIAASSPTIPGEVTFWGKLLGLLMLAASVGKKLLGFIAPLLIDDPLASDRRRRIFEFLKEARMAHRRQIHRATGIPNASLEHHLRVLLEHDLIVEVKQNGYTVYFSTSGELGYEDMKKLALLADPTRRSIAERIVQEGGRTQTDLAEEEGLSRGQVSRQLSKLSEASLVRVGDGWPRPYRPSPLLRRWLSQVTGSE